MVMPAFQKFRGEAAIIGRLLAGYAELEIDLLNCVSEVTQDFDATLKAMFRVRAEYIWACPRHSCASPKYTFRGGVLIFRNPECRYLSIYDSQPSCPSQPVHCRNEGRHRSRARFRRACARCGLPRGGC